MKKLSMGGKAALRRYSELLHDIKARIQQAQNRAVMSVNAEMIRMYWDIGHMVALKQENKGWGAAVVPRLSSDLRNDLPDTKGFSERNINRMIAFSGRIQVWINFYHKLWQKAGPPIKWKTCLCWFP